MGYNGGASSAQGNAKHGFKVTFVRAGFDMKARAHVAENLSKKARQVVRLNAFRTGKKQRGLK